MSYKFGYPVINIWMFINDWNANIPSSIMARVYKLNTELRVNAYASKLRKDGHNLVRRSRGLAKKEAK